MSGGVVVPMLINSKGGSFGTLSLLLGIMIYVFVAIAINNNMYLNFFSAVLFSFPLWLVGTWVDYYVFGKSILYVDIIFLVFTLVSGFFLQQYFENTLIKINGSIN